MPEKEILLEHELILRIKGDDHFLEHYQNSLWLTAAQANAIATALTLKSKVTFNNLRGATAFVVFANLDKTTVEIRTDGACIGVRTTEYSQADLKALWDRFNEVCLILDIQSS